MKEQQQIERCKNEWFKNHRAEILSQTEHATIIAWQNPENWNYGCRYILHRRWCIVVGDIGEATYEWGRDVTLQFIAGCDFHYFFGKCQASEVGRRYTQWDSTHAANRVKEMRNEFDSGMLPKWMDDLAELSASDPKDEFENAARRAYENGMDPMDASLIMEAGTIPHCRAIGHWVGIQMAYAQLFPDAQRKN